MKTDAEVREKLTERFREAAVASDASTLMILAADEWLQTALDSLSQPETEPRGQVRDEECESCNDTGIYEEGAEWAPCGECDLGLRWAELLKVHADEMRRIAWAKVLAEPEAGKRYTRDEIEEALTAHYGKGAERLRRYRLGIGYDEYGREIKEDSLPDYLCSGDMIAALGCIRDIFGAAFPPEAEPGEETHG